MEKVAIASDHAGFKLKSKIINYLANKFEVINLGTNDENPVDYPDYAANLVTYVKANNIKKSILICGSGIGMSIAANRDPYIRAALCYNKGSAMLARQHNDANILVLGSNMSSEDEAIEIVEMFFLTEFEAGRHQRRIEKLC